MSDDPMHDVLDRWKTAFDGHETDVLAGLFTPDALFQGFGPAVISGRPAIRACYDAVPDNRSGGCDDPSHLHDQHPLGHPTERALSS